MAKFKGYFGSLLFLGLSLAPAAFWLAMQPLSGRFADWQASLTSFGQLAGLIGMAMFSLNLVLSARLKCLEGIFGGLNRIYLNHHSFGAIAFILLLLHPLLLVAKYVPISLRAAAEFFLPSGNAAVNFGIFGLLLMMILLAITFYGKLTYQKWRFTHQYLGLAFFLGSLHTFFIDSDISRSLPLRAYLSSLIILGFAGIAYRTLFSLLLVRKYSYQVRSVRKLNGDIIDIELAAKDRQIDYRPGQFIFISFDQPGIGREYHPFTISSSPSDHYLRLTVKHLGDFTGDLMALTEGASASIEGPFGKFSFLETEAKKQIWIAGGIGITPFLSMARSLKEHSGYQIDLFYCVKTAAEQVFIDELNDISGQSGQLRLISFCADTDGFISAGIVKDRSGINDKEIFVCGPPALMSSLKKQFYELGVKDHRIHSEEFGFQQ